MVHILRISILLGLLAGSPSASGQIQIKPIYRLGEPIVVTATLEASGDEVDCSWLSFDDGCRIVEVDGGKAAHVWAMPGDHELLLATAAIVDGRPSSHIYGASFRVEGSVPVPDHRRLAELVEPGDAETLAEFHDDWARAVAEGKVTSRPQFDQAYQQLRGGLDYLGDVTAALAMVDNRLGAIEGCGEELAAELVFIAGDFRPAPVPPDPNPPEPVPPASGPRVVLIVHESQDATPQLKGQFVLLRKDPAASYLKAGGHLLLIWDDDLADGDDANKADLLAKYAPAIQQVGLPALLIIDKKTGEVLHSERIQPGMTADNITERLRQHGG